MATYRPYSRRVFERRFVEWVRRSLRQIVLLTIGMAGLIALVTWWILATMPQSGFRSWVLGALHVGIVATYAHLLHAGFLVHDQHAIRHLRGAWGEENTRNELRRARRRRVIWGWVDSIPLQVGDLDHVVVTRRGGLVAIDSKWRSVASDQVEMARSARKARMRAEGVAHSLLKSRFGARHRARTDPLRVTPVVVLWGAAQRGVAEGTQVDGIEFVSGRRLVAWLRKLDGEPVDGAAANDLLEKLEGYRASTWATTQHGVDSAH